MKLAAELARPDTGRTLYILDEPTTGLHLDDVRKLLDVVHRLADLGNTVVDHRAQPRGDQDGRLGHRPRPRGRPRRAARSSPRGRPRTIAEAKASLTGAILKGVLAAGPHAERPRFDPKAAARKVARRGEGGRAARARPTDGQAPLGGRRPALAHPRPRRPQRPPARWDGRILERVVDRIEELGGVRPDRLVAARQSSGSAAPRTRALPSSSRR